MNQLNTTAQRTAVVTGARQQAMEQLLVGLRRVRISGWLLAGLSLTTLFLILNRELISRARVQTWDATAYNTPVFSLVADHARVGRLLLWDPWLAGGTPDFADPPGWRSIPRYGDCRCDRWR